MILCGCGCGEQLGEFDYRGRSRKYIRGHSFKGKHHTPEAIEKNRLTHLGKTTWNKNLKDIHLSPQSEFKKGRYGELSGHWKGGITKLNHLIRTSSQWREWRLMVFGRDNYTCQECGIRGVYLHPHHIKQVKDIIKEYNIQTKEEAIGCRELWDISNGITYCIPHHKLLKNRGGLLRA